MFGDRKAVLQSFPLLPNVTDFHWRKYGFTNSPQIKIKNPVIYMSQTVTTIRHLWQRLYQQEHSLGSDGDLRPAKRRRMTWRKEV